MTSHTPTRNVNDSRKPRARKGSGTRAESTSAGRDGNGPDETLPGSTGPDDRVMAEQSVASAAAETFRALQLPKPLLQALDDVGYEHPTPIQRLTIPPLLGGADVLGHAPTGTGKTAAFALPLIARQLAAAAANTGGDAGSPVTRAGKGRQARPVADSVRILVLAPTRELAIQVAEAFKRYATHLSDFSVVPIYGGQDYTVQLRQLARGVQVVVGTPGRVMDHMRRGTLKLDTLSALVLDEADEMLRMGFIDDIDWILDQTPAHRQMALFSATMPRPIQKIALKHLNDPVRIAIESRTTTAETINQRFWLVSGVHKLDALTRILEAERVDAVLVFVRTRTATVELADRLGARGHRAAPINGDLPQKQREKMIDQFKRGALDILVATDVAARGLDVERISHVINYDIPYDTEAYVHRIGRTGRAGRHGEAILFVTPRERRMLHTIEKATRQRITQLELPTTGMVNDKRVNDFKQRIHDTLNRDENVQMRRLVEDFQQEFNVPATDVAAALAVMALGDQPLLLKEDGKGKRHDRSGPAAGTDQTGRPRTDTGALTAKPEHKPKPERQPKTEAPPARGRQLAPDTQSDPPASSPLRATATDASEPPRRQRSEPAPMRQSATATPAKSAEPAALGSGSTNAMADDPAIDMERFRVEVGAGDNMKAANLVGAIANEAGIDAVYIGKIDILDDHSFVELPSGMPKEIFKDLKQTWVCGKRLRMTRATAAGASKAKVGSEGRSKNRDKNAGRVKGKRDDSRKSSSKARTAGKDKR